MAVTQLSDLQFGPNWERYTTEAATRLNAFAASGVLVRDPYLDSLAAQQGITYNLPHYKRLVKNEPNVSSDDPAQKATPQKIGTGVEVARKLMRNNGWSSADLNTAFIANDPMAEIGNQVGEYWAAVNQDTVLNTALGLLADNIANDSGDMLVNVATDATGAPTDAELFGTDIMINAAQTMGDAKAKLVAIAVHSVIHARMQRIGALTDHFDPETGALAFQSFQGKRVIMDDGMPVTVGTNRVTYTSILFGAGAFRHGAGSPKTPTEVEREAAGGNGEGIETLWNRRQDIVHPTGFAWKEASVAGDSPTYAELKAAANWDRAFERKNVPLAFVRTNG